MMHAFWQLDTLQREARGLTDEFQRVLPERAARSGLVPRHRLLDQQVDALAVDYLAIIDRYPEPEGLRPSAQQAALAAFRQVHERLNSLSAEMERFFEQYAAEFRAIGVQKGKLQRQKDQAATALRHAHEAATGLRAQGLESRSVDDALTAARTAARALDDWTPERGVDDFVGLTRLVVEASERAVKAASEFPDKVHRVQRRVPSLRTRLEAIDTRSSALEGTLTALRRDFAVEDWRDLEAQPDRVDSLARSARAGVTRLEAAVQDEDWDTALHELDSAERLLDQADGAVDAPHRRLTLLLEVKADPKPALRRARFRLRDAQMLVTHSGLEPTLARELDGLAVRLDRARGLLAGMHPSYWALLIELERIELAVAGVVQRHRERLQ